jgi:ribosomal protein L19
MNKIDELNKNQLRTDLPPVEIGERVEIISSKDNRTTHFKGIVIDKKNPSNINYTFHVLKESDRVGVISVFSYHSPFIKSIKKIGKINQKVRRAKLSYLERGLAKKKDNI